MIVNVINRGNNPLPKYETVGAAGLDLMANLPCNLENSSKAASDLEIKGKNFDSKIDTFYQLARRLDEVIHVTEKQIQKLTYQKKYDNFL